MRRTFIAAFLLVPAIAFGQALPNINSATVRYNSQKTAAKAEGELKAGLDEVDKAGNGQPDWFVGKPVHEIAALLKADSVLFIRIKEWDKDNLLPYKSLNIEAAFELHSAVGKVLWKAEYSTSEADLGLDSRPMELAVHNAFEPRIQRFVDAVFSTLPPGEADTSQRKTYFQWLP